MQSLYKILFLLTCILLSYLTINFGGVFISDMKLTMIFSLILCIFLIIKFRNFRSILFINLILILSLFYQVIYLPPYVIRIISPETYAVYANLIPRYADPSESKIINKIAEDENIGGYETLIFQVYQDRGYSPLLIPDDTRRQPLSFIRKNTYRKITILACIYIIALFISLYSSFGRSSKKNFERIFLLFIIFLSFIHFIIGFRNIVSPTPSHLGYYKPSSAFTGTFVNKNHISSHLLMLTLVLTGYIASALYKSYKNSRSSKIKQILLDIYYSRQWYYLLIFPVICGLAAAIFAAQSRMGVFAFMVSLSAFFLFYTIMFSAHRNLYSAISIILILLIIIFSLRFFVQDDDLYRIMERYEMTTISEIRFKTYGHAIDLIKMFPVTGIGMGNTALMLSTVMKGTRRTAGRFGYWLVFLHNDLLQFILEGGIIALLILSLFIYDILKKLFKSIKRRKIKNIAYFCALMGIMLHSIIDFNLHIPANLFLFMVIYGLYSEKGNNIK